MVLPITATVETTPFVPRRAAHSNDRVDAKDKFDQKEKFDTASPLATHRQVDGALYTLEFPVICPHCEAQITTFRVFRLLRTQVSFTSTLPRKGYVIVCPECERPISSELSGLI